jgi:hypothetical protein
MIKHANDLTRFRNRLQEFGTINLAVGAEAASDLYGSDQWGAASSPVISGDQLEEK